MGTPFPAEWMLFPGEEFPAFHREAFDDSPRGLHVLINLDEQHKASAFRLCLFGGDGPIRARIALKAFLQPVPEQLTGYSIQFACPIDHATPGENSTVTPWTDVEQLLRDGSVTVFNEEEEEVEKNQVLDFVAQPGTDKTCVGASFRWAVTGSDDSKQIRLELQCLPTQAKYLNRAHLKGDNSVYMSMGAIPLRVELFDGQVARGPVPLFFSTQGDDALAYLTDNPDAVLEDIMEVNDRILCMEQLTLEEALTYLKKRTRAARGFPAFPMDKRPKNKRARIETPVNTESGTVLNFVII